MDFQLVRANETEIVIWNPDHGHIFVYKVQPGTHALAQIYCKDIPDADQDAASMTEEAFRFATGEARVRHLLD